MSYLCYLSLFTYCGVKHVLTIWVTWRVHYKRQEVPTLPEHLGSPLVFGVFRGAQIFNFLCCVVFFAFFVFVLCLVCEMLPVSLACPFLIAPSIFSNIYFSWIIYIQENICKYMLAMSNIFTTISIFYLSFIYVTINNFLEDYVYVTITKSYDDYIRLSMWQ
jgi:hypothetical protein